MAENCKDTVAELINLEIKSDGMLANKVANFAYTKTAYDNNDMQGVTVYDYDKEQNIPVGTAKGIDSNPTVLNKGYRSMGASIARMVANHFFGRCSYNLNKIHDWFTQFLRSFAKYMKGSINIWDPNVTYAEGEFCFIYTDKHLFRQYKSLKNANIGHDPKDLTQNGEWWELMSASWDLRETGNALSTSGNTDMNNLTKPATYKNVRLTGVKSIPKEIEQIEAAGNGSYSTIVIENGPGFVKQYIYYVNPETAVGNNSGHYLTMRGGLLSPEGVATNWTEWEFRVEDANRVGGKDVTSLKQTMFDMMNPIENLGKGIKGKRYVQLPGEDDPNVMFNRDGIKSTWEDITTTYDGRFFKLDNTNDSGTTTAESNKESLPNIKGELNVFREGIGWQNNFFDNNLAWKRASNSVAIVSYSGDAPGQVLTLDASKKYTNAEGSTFEETAYKDGAKVQPDNVSIKLWKRIA